MKKDLNEPFLEKEKEQEQKISWFNNSVLKSYQDEQENRWKHPQILHPADTNPEAAPLDPKKAIYDPTRIQIDNSEQLKLAKEKAATSFEAKDMEYYAQATAVHSIPQTVIMATSILKQNPSIFAVFSEASPAFESIELFEHMALEDYKKLSQLRIRNYVAVIKMLYKIYYGHASQNEKFLEFRTKLFQVQALIKFLDFEEQYRVMYSKIRDGNSFIFTEKEKDLLETGGGKQGEPDFVDEDEERLGDFDSDEEYEEFFNQSKMSNGVEIEGQELRREEEKWIKRAEWMEEQLQALLRDQDLVRWHQWFQAKIDCLVDLDVKVKTGSVEQSNEVFYLHQFLDEECHIFNPSEDYEATQKVQIDNNNLYPVLNVNTKELNQDFSAVFRCKTEIREKLCLKVQKREADTHYFLTVFEKKPFGNEKLYRKRINVRHRGAIREVSDFHFHPSGEYVHISWTYNHLDEDQVIKLVFPLKAYYKNPLLIKPDSSFLRFKDKYLYCRVDDKVYEYDLYQYNNVKVQFLKNVVQEYENCKELFFNKSTDQGYQYIGTPENESSDEIKTSNSNYVISMKNELYQIDPNEKVTYDPNNQLVINRKGDSMLLGQWKEGLLTFTKLILDTKGNQKQFKKEGVLGLKNKDLFSLEKGKLEYKIIPLQTNFAIMFLSQKQPKKIFIFLNATFLACIDTDGGAIFDEIYLNEDRNGTVASIFVLDENEHFKNNILSFTILREEIAKADKSKVWVQTKVSHQIVNRQYQLCYPYLTFIYNHDQVFMKDLTKVAYSPPSSSNGQEPEKRNVFYYMNHFMGIDKSQRPVTVFQVSYNNKLVLLVPTINRNYTSDNFLFRMHSVKTRNQQLNRTRLEGRVLFRQYAWNQEMIQNELSSWFSQYVDAKLNLYQDIRVLNKNNGISIERWEGQKCLSRFLISYYNTPFSPDLNVTDESDISFRNWGFWLLVIQRDSYVQIFTKEMDKQFGLDTMKELEPIYQCQIDDQNEEIYDIIIDNLEKDKLNVFFVQSNAAIKRLSSSISYFNGVTSLTEDANMYTIDSFFSKKKAGGAGESKDKTGGSSGASKKVSLWDYKPDVIIANRMVYLQNVVIDLKPVKQEKLQTGVNLGQYFNGEVTKLMLSVSESKVAAILVHPDKSTLVDVVISPLLNARQLPMFHGNQFFHPVVPMTNQEKGFVSVLTLNIGNQYCAYQEITHQKYKKKYYNYLKLMEPGFIIKFFNGVEKRVPLSDFGEHFLDIVRFNQSTDGKFAIIAGTRVEKDRVNQGIFMYEVGIDFITRVMAFPFAEKDMNQLDFETRQAMKQTERVYESVEREIQGHQYNEYSSDYSEDYPFLQRFYDYLDEIDYDSYDEELKKAELWLKYKQEFDKVNKGKKGFNLFGSNDHLQVTEEDIMDKVNKDEAYAKITKLEHIKENFPHFDICYLQSPPEAKVLNDQDRDIYVVKEIGGGTAPVQEKVAAVTEEEEKKDGDEEQKEEPGLYSAEEVDKIAKMHQNMILSVNDQGHIILIERLHNKVYFFYKDADSYKIHTIKFDKDFRINFADSSPDYLVVASDDRYQVYEITGNSGIKFMNAYGTEAQIKCLIDSKPTKAADKNEKINVDNYDLTILDIRLKNNILIQKVTDNTGFPFVILYDIRKEINLLYLEGDQIAISGDKQYLWLVKKNQVYDVINGLTTFFFWPGEQISTPGYDSGDLFNVTEDRAMMVTQGYVQLAFNIVSMHMESNKLPQFSQLAYLYYKIGNNRSILERIFKEDGDKKAIRWDEVDAKPAEEENQEGEQEEAKVEEVVPRVLSPEELEKEKEEGIYKIVSGQMKSLSQYTNYFTDNVPKDDTNKANLAHFFMTYYYVQGDNDGGVPSRYLNIFQKMYALDKNKRTDIIEDILNDVVQNEFPIKQMVINSSFLDFLKTANSSQAFQDYLKNATKQTTKMLDVEKFQIASTEEGYIVDSHSSPLMDNAFQAYFRKQDQLKIDVTLSYVNLGQILSEKGEEIMDELSDEKFLPIMDIPFIQYLVMYQWLKVRRTIQKKLLIPFFVLLGMFFLYATFQIDWQRDNFTTELRDVDVNGTITQVEVSVNHAGDPNSFMWHLNVFALLGILFYLYFMEIKQVINNPGDYVRDFWNMADLVNYTMCTSVIILDTVRAQITIMRPIASVCVIILWIKLFYFLRVFESTSRLIRMIIEIVNDMKNFMVVLIIGILGFANGFYILSQNQKDDQEPFAGASFAEAIIYTYRLTLGDFSTDAFYTLYPVDVIIVWIIFIIASLFVVIVLLNLLIAIMGDTFGRVLENITNLTIREKVKLVAENEALFDRMQIFKNSQYLIVIKEKNLEALQSENWDGQMNALKRTIMDKIGALEATIDSKMGETQSELKKRFQDFDEKSKKQSGQSETRLTGSMKTDLDGVAQKVSDYMNGLSEKLTNQQATILSLQEQMKMVKVGNQKVDGLVSDVSKFRDLMCKQFNIDPKAGQVLEESDDE